MRAGFVIVLGLTAGCYSYFPLTTATPDPGTAVTVKLTDAGARELERTLGTEVFLINGRYVSADERLFAMAVASAESRGVYRHVSPGRLVSGLMFVLASARNEEI